MKQNRRYHWKDKTQSYSIYVCKRNSCASVPTDYTDGCVWREVTRVLHEPEFHAAWATPAPTEEAGHAAELREEEATLRRRLTDAAEDYAAGILTRAQVQTIITKTRVRLEQIESELAEIGSAYDLSSVLGDLEYVYEQIDSMSPNEQRALVRAVVEQVTLHPRPKGTKKLTPECVVVSLRSPADIRRHE